MMRSRVVCELHPRSQTAAATIKVMYKNIIIKSPVRTMFQTYFLWTLERCFICEPIDLSQIFHSLQISKR